MSARVGKAMRRAFAAVLTLQFSPAAWGQAAGSPAARPAQVAPARTAPSGAALLSFKGEVSIQRFGDPSPQRVAAAPTVLRTWDKVVTGPGASALLRMTDFSEIRLGPGSEVTIAVQKRGLLSLFLWSGKLWANAVTDRTRRFEVRAPGAVVTARGTRFSVEMVDAKNAAIEVYEGAVAVDGLKGSRPLRKPALVLPGQRVELLGGAAPGMVRTLIAPKPGAAAALNREPLIAQLKTALARALAARRVDVETAIKEALDSGDAARMNRIASALSGSSDLDADQKEAVGKAFAEGRSLSDALAPAAPPPPPPAAPKPAPISKPAVAQDGSQRRAVLREIGRQSEQDSQQYALALASAGSTASGIGGRVSALAAQGRYTSISPTYSSVSLTTPVYAPPPCVTLCD